jgi:hypothetical protein
LSGGSTSVIYRRVAGCTIDAMMKKCEVFTIATREEHELQLYNFHPLVRSLDPNDPLTHHASILHRDRTRLFSRILDHLASLVDFEDGVLRLCEQDHGSVVGDRVELGDGAAEVTLGVSACRGDDSEGLEYIPHCAHEHEHDQYQTPNPDGPDLTGLRDRLSRLSCTSSAS